MILEKLQLHRGNLVPKAHKKALINLYVGDAIMAFVDTIKLQ